MCVDCNQYRRWKGDPQCPKVQSGEVKPFVPKKRDVHVTWVGVADVRENQPEEAEDGDEEDQPDEKKLEIAATGAGETGGRSTHAPCSAGGWPPPAHPRCRTAP